MKNHLKSYTIPKFWPVPKKKKKFIIRPCPGPHAKDQCFPLQVVLRDLLGFAKDAREIREILNSGKVLVDKKARKDPKFPVGLMDVIELPEAKASYVILPTERGLSVLELTDSNTKKLCKITGKKIVKKGKIQINLHDGKNIFIDKKSFKVGDSLLLSLPDLKVIKHFSLQKGEDAIIIGGKNIGSVGRIKEISKKTHMLDRNTITITSDGKDIETLKKYVLVGEIPKTKQEKKKAFPKTPIKAEEESVKKEADEKKIKGSEIGKKEEKKSKKIL